MERHKLLIIGAGIGQVPLIQKARRRGIHTVVVTLPGKQPGVELADEVFYCDIFERDTIVAWAKEHQITAVTSDQNDLMNPTVAYVAEKLGLPGNRFEQVVAYCDKNVYRDNCDKIGNPVPKHVAVKDRDYDFSNFHCPLPWIVKPADSQSSVGVQKISDLADLRPALEFALGKSRSHTAIVEEFFVGKEVVCEGFIEDGKFYLLAFGDRKYFDLKELMIPAQTIFPSVRRPELLREVLACEERMAGFVRPSFAIVHSEYLVNEANSTICAVESALRGGGVYISSHLIPMATGIDINDVLLDKVLGLPVDLERVFSRKQMAAAGYVCFYLPPGVVVEVSGVEELINLPFVKMACLDFVQPGRKTERMLHKGQRNGPILVAGKDREDIEKNIRVVQELLKIKVQSGGIQTSEIHWK